VDKALFLPVALLLAGSSCSPNAGRDPSAGGSGGATLSESGGGYWSSLQTSGGAGSRVVANGGDTHGGGGSPASTLTGGHANGGAASGRAPDGAAPDGGVADGGVANGGAPNTDAGDRDASTQDGGALRAYATWYSALDNANSSIVGFMFPPPLPLTNATVRQVAHVALGGSRIRVKFSNRYGASPLPLERVRIASSLAHGAIDVATNTAITFGGATSVTINPGKELWSDAVDFDLAERDDLAVSAFVAGTADLATEHRFAQRTNYVSIGDATSSADVTATAQPISSGYWLNEIDVLRASPTNVIVSFGDSITDGNGSTPDADLRYPDQLSRLALATDSVPAPLSVVNAGIGGNRWLHDGLGDKASGRFATDALGVSGVSHVIVLLGINDIGFSVFSSAEGVTAEDIVAAMTNAIHAAKAARLKVFLGTLLPFGASLYYTADGETERNAVNTWIRTSGIADGVFDFDELLRDASDPTKYAASYDSGDHLHPNDAGYAVMAKSIQLNKLR
jgi:lysophospholipase L1-like esterase